MGQLFHVTEIRFSTTVTSTTVTTPVEVWSNCWSSNCHRWAEHRTTLGLPWVSSEMSVQIPHLSRREPSTRTSCPGDQVTPGVTPRSRPVSSVDSPCSVLLHERSVDICSKVYTIAILTYLVPTLIIDSTSLSSEWTGFRFTLVQIVLSATLHSELRIGVISMPPPPRLGSHTNDVPEGPINRLPSL